MIDFQIVDPDQEWRVLGKFSGVFAVVSGVVQIATVDDVAWPDSPWPCLRAVDAPGSAIYKLWKPEQLVAEHDQFGRKMLTVNVIPFDQFLDDLIARRQEIDAIKAGFAATAETFRSG